MVSSSTREKQKPRVLALWVGYEQKRRRGKRFLVKMASSSGRRFLQSSARSFLNSTPRRTQSPPSVASRSSNLGGLAPTIPHPAPRRQPFFSSSRLYFIHNYSCICIYLYIYYQSVKLLSVHIHCSLFVRHFLSSF